MQTFQKKLHGSRFTPAVGANVGYGYAAVETIRALQRQEIRVSYNTFIPKVHISFVQPDFYDGIPDQYRIGYTPWESTEIPKHWQLRMQQQDEIWTTSTFCKEIYEENKVNDIIRVVPHGIDPEIWKIHFRCLTDKFIFLHVGGSTARKGGQRTVDAFLDLFGDNEEVWLIMKSNGASEARFTDKQGRFLNVRYHERIIVIEDQLDIYDLVKLYNKSNCLVYPTNGEGFGLIPFQGIASGLPTITTNGTACKDFADMSIPLDCHPHKGVGIHLGDWVEPDKDDLRDKMLYVYENFDKARDKTLNSAKLIHENQTWDKVGEQIVGILGDKIYEKV